MNDKDYISDMTDAETWAEYAWRLDEKLAERDVTIAEMREFIEIAADLIGDYHTDYDRMEKLETDIRIYLESNQGAAQ